MYIATARREFLEVVGPELATAFTAITRTGMAATARYVVRSR
jgi:hypothetical protein